MDDLQIVIADAHHLRQVEAWADQDASKILLEQSGTTALQHGSAWVVLVHGEPVAVATIQLDNEHVGYLDFGVKPNERRQGIGARLVAYVLQQPQVRVLHRLHALIEPQNTAAQKIVTRQGFSNVGYAPDGRLEFAKH